METNVRKRKRVRFVLRVSAAAALVLLCIFYIGVPPVRSQINGWVMLYTQKSAQSVQGAILRAGCFAPLKAVALSAFQSFALPWLSPYGIGGSVLTFGRALGGMLSTLGALTGASVWYGLARLFLGNVPHKSGMSPCLRPWTEFCLIAALNWLTLGMLSIPAAVAGAARTKYARFLLFALLAELPVAVLFAAYCAPYRTLPPNAAATTMRLFGVPLMLAAAAMKIADAKKNAGGGPAVKERQLKSDENAD